MPAARGVRTSGLANWLRSRKTRALARRFGEPIGSVLLEPGSHFLVRQPVDRVDVQSLEQTLDVLCVRRPHGDLVRWGDRRRNPPASINVSSAVAQKRRLLATAMVARPSASFGTVLANGLLATRAGSLASRLSRARSPRPQRISGLARQVGNRLVGKLELGLDVRHLASRAARHLVGIEVAWGLLLPVRARGGRRPFRPAPRLHCACASLPRRAEVQRHEGAGQSGGLLVLLFRRARVAARIPARADVCAIGRRGRRRHRRPAPRPAGPLLPVARCAAAISACLARRPSSLWLSAT